MEVSVHPVPALGILGTGNAFPMHLGGGTMKLLPFTAVTGLIALMVTVFRIGKRLKQSRARLETA